MWKARSFKHSETTSNVLVFNLCTNEQVKLISFIWEGVDFTLGIRYAPLNSAWFAAVIRAVRKRNHFGRYTKGWYNTSPYTATEAFRTIFVSMSEQRQIRHTSWWDLWKPWTRTLSGTLDHKAAGSVWLFPVTIDTVRNVCGILYTYGVTIHWPMPESFG